MPGLASKLDTPDLCLLSSKDYRYDPPVPGTLEPSILTENLRYKTSGFVSRW
jgi:hypothetical protein